MTTIVEVIVNPSNLYIDVITQQSLTVEEINSFISLPAGGSTGQVLSKASNTTGDIVWSNDGGATATNLTIANKNSTTFDVLSSTGTDVTLPAATTSEAGLLIASDKTKLDNLATVATSGSYTDLTGTPAIPAAQVNSDWDSVSGVSQILNKPTLGTASPLNIAASGNAASGEVVKGNDTRLSDSRTPTAHTHVIADTTGLQTALDGKAALGANSDITSLSGITGSISTVDSIQFDTAAAVAPAVGKLTWNDTDGTLEVGLKGGNVTLQIGQEAHQRVTNNSGASIPDGSVVYITGSLGNRLTVAPAIASNEPVAMRTFGVLTETVADNQSGFVTTLGLVRDINTSALTEGAPIYLSASVTGGLTNTRPASPNHAVMIGWCVRQHASVGSIFVHVQNGEDLSELHDVLVVTETDKDVLSYENATGLWKNKQLNSTYITDFNTAADARVAAGITGKEGTITAGTTAQYWRGDKSWQTLNSTAVGLGNVNNTSDANKPVSAATQTALNLKYDASNPSGYTTNTGTVTTASIVTANGFSGSVANASTTPAITISLQNATTGQSGQLTSADWNTFNGKQEALVSGTNIKTVNGTSLLGSGDVVISGITSGTSTVSFGSTATNEAQLIVTGQSGIDAGTKVIASIGTTATSDYTVNDHKYLGALGVSVTVGDIAASTGFTIYVRSYQKMTGDISINWVY